ncbi:MAG TPA: hypothetical protein VL285_06805 [Bryobacteraceae bacterium]|nr:hypothetical protein [Bryobacteraceae bacterium]
MELHGRVRKLSDGAMERPETERFSFRESECAGETGLYRAVARQLEANLFLEGETPCTSAVDPLIGRTPAVKMIRPAASTDRTKRDSRASRCPLKLRQTRGLGRPGAIVEFGSSRAGSAASITLNS